MGKGLRHRAGLKELPNPISSCKRWENYGIFTKLTSKISRPEYPFLSTMPLYINIGNGKIKHNLELWLRSVAVLLSKSKQKV